MKRVPDRKTLRREYLRKKRKAYAPGYCSVAFVLTFLFVETTLHRWMHRTPPVEVVMFIGIVFARYVWMTCKTVKTVREQAAQIPYVPPVTPNTLPAEEILIRGAAEPSAPSETLLRATVKGEETKAEELLRVASGMGGEQER